MQQRELSVISSFDYYRNMLDQEKGQRCWRFDCAGSSWRQVEFDSVLVRKMSHKQFKQKLLVVFVERNKVSFIPSDATGLSNLKSNFSGFNIKFQV